MLLSSFGQIANDELWILPSRFKNIELHTFQIMPNHLHLILSIRSIPKNYSGELTFAGASPASTQFPISITGIGTEKQSGLDENKNEIQSKDLSEIIGSYKSLVANKCLDLHKNTFAGSNYIPVLGKIWKRSFNDKIIRDEASYKSISRYIRNNPKRWTYL